MIPTNKVHQQLMLVTPEMAEKWLEKNTNNRDIKQSVVNRYRDDMENGRWKLTHQGIAFNCDGTVLDGQHRLWAIVLSRTSQWMFVTFGVDKSASTAIDDHGKRSAADALQIVYGVKEHKKDATATAPYLMGRGGVVTNAYKSRQLLIETHEKHRKAIEWSLEVMPTKMKGLCRAPVRGVLARAYYTQDRSRLEYFCRVLIDPTQSQDSESDRAIFMLRDFLTMKAKGGSSGLAESYRKTAYVLSAWLVGRRVSRLYEPTEELFLLPDEG